MNILVTGAAGFVGSHLAERLVHEGHAVRGIDNLDPYYLPAFKEHTFKKVAASGVEMHRLDLAEDDLTEVVAGVDTIFHFAAQPGNSARTHFDTYVRNNIIATRRLLLAVQEASSIERFINIATSSIYGHFAERGEDEVAQPISNYGVTKLAAEQLVLARARDADFPACSLRLYSVYGPRERPDKLYPILIRSIASDTPFPLFDGSREHVRSFTFVGDIVEGCLAVLRNWEKAQGEIFNIGSDTAITTGDAMDIVQSIMGKTAQIEMLPKRPGDQLSTHAKIDKARDLLGYAPEVKPEEGLKQMVEWYLNEIHGKVDYKVA